MFPFSGESAPYSKVSLLDELDPRLQPWARRLFDLAEAAGVYPRVTSGLRSPATQQKLYEAFLAGHSKYPAAPPGRSAHEYGLAFDMVVQGAVNQRDCGVVWVSWGGRYGGEEDPIHFEHPSFLRRAVRAGPDSTGQASPTVGSVPHTIHELANYVVLSAPTPLRGILSIGEVASALAVYEGVPGALGVSWLLHHPSEVTAAFVTAARKTLLGR